MEKFKYINLVLIAIMLMVLSALSETTSESTEEIPTELATLSSLIKHNKLDENIFPEASSLLQMKTLKIISKSILDVFNNVGTVEKITFGMSSVINNLNKTGINLYEELNINTLNEVKHFIITIPKIREDLKVLSNIMNDINYLFENYYLEYLNGHTSNVSLQIFISKAMSLDTDSPGKSAFLLEKIISSKVDDISDNSFLETIVNEINKNNSKFCLIHKSSQQFMHDWYNFFATIELKSYIMVLSAYKLHAVTSNDNYTKDFERIQAEHFERMKNYLTIFTDILHKSSTEIAACSTEISETQSLLHVKAINKLPKDSDYFNNKVVTGVRFVIKNQVLHVQIEEGELIPNGKILPGSEQWIPIDDMNYDDRTLNRSGRLTRIHECTEYYSISSSDYWYLKDITAPPNFIVVGANFEVLTEESLPYKVIYLRLKFAKVNIATSQFDIGQEHYSDDLRIALPELTNENLAFDSEYVSFRKVDTYGYRNSYRISTRYTPVINLQPLYGNPRLPLMGIGTFNKTSQLESFPELSILLKVFTFDFSSIIDTK